MFWKFLLILILSVFSSSSSFILPLVQSLPKLFSAKQDQTLSAQHLWTISYLSLTDKLNTIRKLVIFLPLKKYSYLEEPAQISSQYFKCAYTCGFSNPSPLLHFCHLLCSFKPLLPGLLCFGFPWWLIISPHCLTVQLFFLHWNLH